MCEKHLRSPRHKEARNPKNRGTWIATKTYLQQILQGFFLPTTLEPLRFVVARSAVPVAERPAVPQLRLPPRRDVLRNPIQSDSGRER